MRSSSSIFLCLPGEKEREHWRLDETGSRQVEDRSGGVEGVFALEVMALESVPFWAVEPKDGELDAGKVASLKWEALGLAESNEGRSFMHWLAGRSGNRVLVGSAGLAEGGAAEWLKVMPVAFEISPRLFPVPFGELALWRELERCVVAFMHEEHLVHFSVMSARVLNTEAAAEIGDLLRALQVQGLVKKLAGVRIWTEAEPSFLSALREILSVPVSVEPKPEPRLADGKCEICPPEVARMRRERRSKQRQSQLVLTLAALYFAFFAGWAGWLEWREHKLDRAHVEVARLRPGVATVRREQMRWQALETAINADLYPTELFQRIVSLLPGEGIRLKEFNLELNKIMVSGEASSIGHAKKFQADVTGSEGLRQYTWNFPQPTFLDDNRANFRAEGILNAGGGHEGE